MRKSLPLLVPSIRAASSEVHPFHPKMVYCLPALGKFFAAARSRSAMLTLLLSSALLLTSSLMGLGGCALPVGTVQFPVPVALTCSQSALSAPGSDACSITLSGPAPSGGVSLNLSSSSSAVLVPASATVPANAESVGFTVKVSSAASPGVVTVTAAANGDKVATSIKVNAVATAPPPPSLAGVACAQASVTAPAAVACTVSLSGAAPAGGSNVQLTSSEAAVSVPASVTVAAGAQSASFTATVGSTAAAGTATITAALNNLTKSSSLQIVAAAPAATLSSLSCVQASVNPSSTDTCAAQLSGAAPSGGVVIQLHSSSSAVTLPASATVAAGATSVTFVANIASSAPAGTVTLTASLNGVTKSTSLQVVAAASALSVSPSSLSFGNVTDGKTSAQTVTVSNSGSSAVVVNSASAAGSGFTLAAVSLPVTLNAGQSLILTVQFSPATAGAASGSLQIGSNSSATPNLSVALSGTGVAPSSVAVTLTPSSVSTVVNSTQQFTASVTGTTNTAVTWSLSGSGCSGSSCGTISPGGLYTAPNAAPSPANVTVTATSQQDTTKQASATVQIVASTGKVYYIAPASAGGSDSNDGLTASTPWLTPQHSVNCGDVLRAEPGTYSASSFNNGQWGSVSCPAGNNVAWVMCTTPFGCTVSGGIYISASYWGLQGFQISTSSGTCVNVAPNFNGNRVEVHHIIVANNIVGPCGFDGIGSVSGYGTNPTIGADYLAYLGNIAYDTGGNSSTCAAALSFWVPIPYDTQAGTHLYMSGNFTWGNTSNCGDGEGIIFDTFDGVEGSSTQPPYAYQAVAENNLSVFNDGPGIQVDLNQNGSGAHAPIYFMHNTSAYNCLGPSNATYCAEIVLGTTVNANASNNLVVAPTQYAFGGGSVTHYGSAAIYAPSSTNQISNEFAYSPYGFGVGSVGSPGFAPGTGNITSTDPLLAGTADPGTPSCSGYATTTACMAKVIANFAPTASAASSYGYQMPSSTPVKNAYYPQWLCSVSDLPAGIVTPGCAP